MFYIPQGQDQFILLLITLDLSQFLVSHLNSLLDGLFNLCFDFYYYLVTSSLSDKKAFTKRE